jgi:DNA-binding CsgD family transcriptional regulator
MDQLPFEPVQRGRGGDTRTPQAKADIAKRENQIVELRLRNISYAAIARVVGVSKTAVINTFKRALHRNTNQDIQTHHRSELAKLEMEETRLWQALDAHKESWQATATCMSGLNRIHVRRAHLLGLDAPTKLDVSGIYRIGTDELSEERRETERAWRSLPVEEQMRIYDAFDAARKGLSAPIETTATVTSEPDDRNPDVEPPADDET